MKKFCYLFFLIISIQSTLAMQNRNQAPKTSYNHGLFLHILRSLEQGTTEPSSLFTIIPASEWVTIRDKHNLHYLGRLVRTTYSLNKEAYERVIEFILLVLTNLDETAKKTDLWAISNIGFDITQLAANRALTPVVKALLEIKRRYTNDTTFKAYVTAVFESDEIYNKPNIRTERSDEEINRSREELLKFKAEMTHRLWPKTHLQAAAQDTLEASEYQVSVPPSGVTQYNTHLYAYLLPPKQHRTHSYSAEDHLIFASDNGQLYHWSRVLKRFAQLPHRMLLYEDEQAYYLQHTCCNDKDCPNPEQCDYQYPVYLSRAPQFDSYLGHEQYERIHHQRDPRDTRSRLQQTTIVRPHQSSSRRRNTHHPYKNVSTSGDLPW